MKKLLIVDMQNGFINQNNEFLIEKIQGLVDSNYFDRIIATRFKNFLGSSFDRLLNWTRLCEKSEQNLSISLPQNALVVNKSTYAIEESIFKQIFTKNDEVYLCGTDYESCVLAIAYQLFDFGIQPHIIIECVGSHSDNTISKRDFEKICLKNFGKDSIIKI